MQIKKTKKLVKASKQSDVGSRTSDFIRKKLLDKGYTKDEVNSMGLKELKEVAEQEDIKVVYNSTTKNYDEAQKHIKAAIDILAKCGKDDIIAKDNIANLSVVMFDLMGDK